MAAYIGRISYSLYLVHWPVAVFATYIFGNDASGLPGLVIQIVMILISAALMHHFVEKPFFSAHNASRKVLRVGTLIIVSAGLAAVSIAVIACGGWNWRLNATQQRVSALEAFGVAPCDRKKISCVFGAVNGAKSAILIGDSYAQHYVSGIDKIANGLGVRVEEHIQQGCLVLSGLVRMGYLNGSIGDDSGHTIDVKSEKMRLEVLRQALERTIREIARPNRHILIIGAQVEAACEFALPHLGVGPFPPHERHAPCEPRSRDNAQRTTMGVDQMLAAVQTEFPGIVSLVFPVNYMCEATCPIIKDGVWLYQDSGHLTVAGSLRFGKRAGAVIANFLEGGTQPGARERPISD